MVMLRGASTREDVEMGLGAAVGTGQVLLEAEHSQASDA